MDRLRGTVSNQVPLAPWQIPVVVGDGLRQGRPLPPFPTQRTLTPTSPPPSFRPLPSPIPFSRVPPFLLQRLTVHTCPFQFLFPFLGSATFFRLSRWLSFFPSFFLSWVGHVQVPNICLMNFLLSILFRVKEANLFRHVKRY